MDAIEWTPLPGHHPGQPHEDVTYVEGEYKGMQVELRESGFLWEWSFYDSKSYDPDLAVARGSHLLRTDAERDLTDYIDGYVGEKRHEWCQMIPDGTDTNGDEWNRCTVHDELVLGDAYICEGYEPPAYKEERRGT